MCHGGGMMIVIMAHHYNDKLNCNGHDLDAVMGLKYKDIKKNNSHFVSTVYPRFNGLNWGRGCPTLMNIH
jgi:hypothetical protein